MAGLDWLTGRPVAHRGLHDAASGVIENTLSAARRAIEGNYAIEIDVQADADLQPVVFHDSSLDRLTTGSGRLSAMSAAELAAVPFKGTDDRIPTLRQFLDVVAGQVPLIIEVKTDGSGQSAFCGRIAEVLEGYGGPVAVMSFDPKTVDSFRIQAPALPRGIVAESFKEEKPEGASAWDTYVQRHLLHAGRTRPHFVAYCIDDLPAVAPLALRWIFGTPLLTWTVRTDAQRERGRRWADQIIFEGFRA
ncbi:glycerophosphodiester phosphodiesterase [Microbaculum marinum]|uniref:Glycerophosphodiester phosphodiesterase n=1 Tax=Microbaculum marinum TaxID=1764581 RepID=A0AAW9RIC2_9HYPH